MHLVVSPITAAQTHPLRHRVLRQGQPRSTCVWEGDDLPTTRHFGLFEGEGVEPVAIVSCMLRPPPHRPGLGGWQGRGMAVDPDRQGEGLGTELLRGVVTLLKVDAASGAQWLWCNARTSAQGFYEGEGFVGVGEVFDIPPIGPHVVMERAL